MSKRISRRDFITKPGIAGAAVGSGLSLPATGASSRSDSPYFNPDPAHIEKRRAGFRVLPNGVDDHANLERALRNTASGGTVRSAAGTCKMGNEAVVPDFDGRLIGAGANRATITCTDFHNYELWEAPGAGKDQGLPIPPPFPGGLIE